MFIQCLKFLGWQHNPQRIRKSSSLQMSWRKTRSQERLSRDPEASLWISGSISAPGLEAGGRCWCLAGPPACLRNLQAGSTRLQLSAPHQIRTGHSGARRVSESHYEEPVPKGSDRQCVFARYSLRTPCMIRPSFCRSCILSLVNGCRSGKAGVPM